MWSLIEIRKKIQMCLIQRIKNKKKNKILETWLKKVFEENKKIVNFVQIKQAIKYSKLKINCEQLFFKWA